MKTLYFNIGFILFVTLLNSTVINVPVDQPYIQDAITAAANGDTVLVQPGYYWDNINFNGKLITVASLYLTTANTSYISSTIIDGDTGGSTVAFINGEDSTAVLTGFTITNGYDNYGGGIQCWDSSPKLEHLKITDNEANNGGGISCRSNSNPIMQNVTITENTGISAGGGLYCSVSSSPILTNVTIMFNSSNYGGGIYCYQDCNPTMESSYILWNGASNYGGGIYCYQSIPNLFDVEIIGNIGSDGGGIHCYDNSNIVLENVTIEDNSATGNGGGIFCHYSDPDLSNVEILENTASTHGGGIYLYNDSSPSFDNVIISNNETQNGNGGGIYCYLDCSPSISVVDVNSNTASDNGGGIYCENNSSPSLTNSLINNNIANHGGGIYCEDSNPSLKNTTIVDNIAYNGGGLIVNNSYAIFPNIENSILWNNSPEEIIILSGAIIVAYSDIEGYWGGIGNIDQAPLFVDPSNEFYNLYYSSPCIDAGNPLSPLDPDGTRADMGAYFFDQSINGEPTITAITDVPNDQGRNIQLLWDKSPHDIPGSSVPLVSYSVWRYDDIFDDRGKYEIYNDPLDILDRATDNIKKNYYWQRDNEILTFIAQVPAVCFDQYAVISPTLIDSSSVSNNYSTFTVLAQTDLSYIYYLSFPDSGYSVDNIAPDETEAYITKNGSSMNISWDEVEYGSFQGNSYPEVNGIWYKIYAGDSPDFIYDEVHLIETVTNLNYNYPIAGEEKKFFKVVVSDQP